jgi:hypothetical protein
MGSSTQGRGLVADKVKWLRQRFKAMDAASCRPCRASYFKIKL